MAREMKERMLDGARYQFHQLSTTEALRYSSRIFKLVIEPMTLAFGAIKGDGPMLEREVDSKLMAEAARVLVERLDEDQFLEIVKRLCGECVLCDGKQVKFDQHYEDRLGHLMNVLTAAVEVQFGSFFDDNGVVSAARSAIRNRSTGPATPTSTGPSGDPSPPA